MTRTRLTTMGAAMVGGAAAAAALLWLSYKNKKKKASSSRIPTSSSSVHKEIRSASTDTSTSSYTLTRVKIPISVLPAQMVEQREEGEARKDDGAPLSSSFAVSEDGFVLCRVVVREGMIGAIDFDNNAATKENGDDDNIQNDNIFPTIDCRGAIVTPCFVDCHVHLDKTNTATRNRNQTGTMEEAWLVKEPRDYQYWMNAKDSTETGKTGTETTVASSNNDLIRRMDFAIRCALHHGTKAIRTHLDGYDYGTNTSQLQSAVYDAYQTIRQRYHGVMELQAVANLYLPLYQLEPETARRHVHHTHQLPGTVALGGYIGNTAATPDAELEQHFDALLELAHEHDHMAIDLHIDETNDPRCCALKPLTAALGRARARGYAGTVVLGHCCALALQTPDVQHDVCQKLAQLGKVTVVANPWTNVALQDRRGTKPPLGVEIPLAVPHTPQWRGLTLLQELRAAGCDVAAASDNVRDYWLSHGSDYDMLNVLKTSMTLGHLDSAPHEGAWVDMATTGAARAMNLISYDNDTTTTTTTSTATTTTSMLDVGQPADLIVFPGARHASELFSRPHNDRIVIRNGRVLETALPDFAELDDLMVGTDESATKGQIV